MKPKISVLVPLYNERENIERLVHEVGKVMETLPNPFELILVDDGSRDGSALLLRQMSQKFPYVKAILFRSNCGQTAALDAGFRHATGEIMVTMDGDLQNDPADIPKMLQHLEQGYDLVAGHRHQRKDGLILRKIPSRIANYLIRKMWKSQLHDLGCSLKVFRKEVSDDLHIYGEMHRFLGLLMEGMGARVIECKVNHRPRVAGKSKYNLSRTFKVLLDLVTIWFMKSYRTKPLHVFGSMGGLLGMASIGLVCWVAYDKIFLEVAVHRNPLFTIATFLAVIGIQFIVLGLLAELLIRTYFEAGDRKPYSIAQKMGFEAFEAAA